MYASSCRARNQRANLPSNPSHPSCQLKTSSQSNQQNYQTKSSTLTLSASNEIFKPPAIDGLLSDFFSPKIFIRIWKKRSEIIFSILIEYTNLGVYAHLD